MWVRGKPIIEVPTILFRPLEEPSQLPDEGWIEALPSEKEKKKKLNAQAAALKVCSYIPSKGKLVVVCFCLFSLCWAHWYSHGKCSHFCLKPPLCLIWSWETHECWAPLTFRARWFGSQFLVQQQQKLGSYICGPNPLLLGENLAVGDSLLITNC